VRTWTGRKENGKRGMREDRMNSRVIGHRWGSSSLYTPPMMVHLAIPETGKEVRDTGVTLHRHLAPYSSKMPFLPNKAAAQRDLANTPVRD
jgi:hypothetical protein